MDDSFRTVLVQEVFEILTSTSWWWLFSRFLIFPIISRALELRFSAFDCFFSAMDSSEEAITELTVHRCEWRKWLMGTGQRFESIGEMLRSTTSSFGFGMLCHPLFVNLWPWPCLCHPVRGESVNLSTGRHVKFVLYYFWPRLLLTFLCHFVQLSSCLCPRFKTRVFVYSFHVPVNLLPFFHTIVNPSFDMSLCQSAVLSCL